MTAIIILISTVNSIQDPSMNVENENEVEALKTLPGQSIVPSKVAGSITTTTASRYNNNAAKEAEDTAENENEILPQERQLPYQLLLFDLALRLLVNTRKQRLILVMMLIVMVTTCRKI
jgi:hypothetical protein